MKRIIRLTESDLTRIVKRVINENEEELGKQELEKENFDGNNFKEDQAINNTLNKVPSNLRQQAKDFIYTFKEKIKGKSIKELLALIRDIRVKTKKERKKEKEKKRQEKNLNEQVTLGNIVVLTLPSLLTILSALLIVIVLYTIFGIIQRRKVKKRLK